ncbi:hypothetical protein [Deinococcus wulumuqiensis]|uniref:Uncharacterized protein n=1 Tax=Deinococcus wulumuqiensis TaxID=980427 RepID=A0AAV4K6Q7_9DEIO|nr:hypothetical protein [Deinococcus wulumuqiensis]QII20720.1 hypothetical protein G6R31_08095 [Deinococcus wulumuqiensis R12]GGI73715.1 hypothetical protein GCM10010914_04700 [Deinococcus wulumuqiensis]GGP30445.1 hypothetical protein GCM10008021_20960 [Deinococcus wulumuqiensis]
MAARKEKAGREKPVNPPGHLATQDLKDRGWTPRLIERFLGPHDLTRENGLKMGRRRLPPVKLYLETRVDEAERDDAFLAAQAKAADARERAARNREVREAKRAALLRAAAEGYTPTIHPEPLRKGAKNKARAPYLAGLERTQRQLEKELGKVTEKESAQLRALLMERLDTALAAAYDWFPAPGQAPAKAPARAEGGGGEARPSDWREWDWD